jgi:ribonuclease HII
MPRRFNGLLRRTDSKAAALFEVGSELLRHIWETSHQRAVEVILDKHGGRNFYAGLLQQALPDTLVLARQEGPAASRYSIAAGGRHLEAVFLPQADARHLLVAAASMIAKYVRELCMELFNTFWTSHVPGLRATAGYPTDAKRFWDAIQPAVLQLGLAPDLLWRER